MYLVLRPTTARFSDHVTDEVEEMSSAREGGGWGGRGLGWLVSTMAHTTPELLGVIPELFEVVRTVDYRVPDDRLFCVCVFVMFVFTLCRAAAQTSAQIVADQVRYESLSL